MQNTRPLIKPELINYKLQPLALQKILQIIMSPNIEFKTFIETKGTQSKL